MSVERAQRTTLFDAGVWRRHEAVARFSLDRRVPKSHVAVRARKLVVCGPGANRDYKLMGLGHKDGIKVYVCEVSRPGNWRRERRLA